MSKTIIVTGTNSGFGKLTAQTLAKDGHQVFATMRGISGKNAEAAKELKNWAETHQLSLEVVEMDVTSDTSVANAAESILKKSGGKVDVIVNNAGIYGGGLHESFTVEDYKNIFEVNVFGPIRVIGAFLPALRKQGSGLLIQISSLMGRFVIPFAGAYTSSKWAIEAIAENLRYELAPLGIDSVIIQPGAFPTEIFHKTYQPGNAAVFGEYGATTEYLQKFMQGFQQMMSGEIPNHPQDVADAVKKLVDTPAGHRPLRVPVDKMMPDTAQPINAAQLAVQEGFLNYMGLGGLLSVEKEEVAA